MTPKIKLFIIIIFMGPVLYFNLLHAEDDDIMRIGIIIDGPWKKNVEYIQMIKSEILQLTENEFDVQFPESKQIEGNWDIPRIKSAVSDLLNDPAVDLILTLGVIASHEIATKEKLDKPVVAPFILDPKIQGVPYKKGVSDFKNLSYIHTPFTSKNTIQDFRRVVEFQSMAYLINSSYVQIIPQLIENIQLLTNQLGIKTEILIVEESADAVLAKIPADVEAVYISPLLNLPDYEFDHLIDKLKARKLPSFSLMGTADVKRGLYMSNRPDIFPRVARRIALNIQRILIGDKPSEIPVYFNPGEQITINMATVRDIGIYPKVDVLTEAELLNQDQVEIGKILNLEEAIFGAVDANLDVKAKNKFVSAGSENIALARAPLFPQIDLFGQGVMIDKDRAETSFGTQPEKMITGTLSGSQLIYSEPVWANLSIQSSIQLTREAELDQLELDIMLDAATAYFDLLRALNIETIEKENLKRTKSNLEMARVRESVGSAGPAEVFRWESQLAQNRNTVIQVIAARNVTRINLNRILHRKLDQQYIVLDKNIYTDELSQSDNIFKKYLSDLRTFDILPEFLVQEGLANSPELRALTNAIEAQERARTSASNSFWAPTLALQADYTSILKRSGAGSERISFIPGTNPPDDKFWNVALNLSFPLFTGAERFAQRRQSSEELAQLQLEYESVSEKLEQLIRSRIVITGASFAAIEQTRLGAEAAEKSLRVVQDSYAQGAATILDLLDAQNTALVSSELASNAIYDFIIELMTTERALGKFYIQMSDDEIEGFRSRLEAYVSEK